MKQLVVGPIQHKKRGNGITLITDAISKYSKFKDVKFIFKNERKKNIFNQILYFFFPCGIADIFLIIKVWRFVKKNSITKILFIGPDNGLNSLLVSFFCNVTVNCTLVDSKTLYYKRASIAEKKISTKIKYFIGYSISKYTYIIIGKLNKNIKYIFVSDEDANAVSSYFEKVVVIKNGTDLMNINYKSFSKIRNPKFIFHGDFSYIPNIIARKSFINFSNVTKSQGIVFGKNNDEESNSNTKIIDYVKDKSAYLNSKYIYFCPLPYGAGIKNKVLEAMAAGMLVVGTKYAFDGIDKSKIEYIEFNLSDIKKINGAIEMHNLILDKYNKYNQRLNVDYICMHHNWNDVVDRYLTL